jgi:predicted nucleotidyltransferase
VDKRQTVKLIKARAEPFNEPGVTALFLYGSTARGSAEPGSDIDLFADLKVSAGENAH